MENQTKIKKILLSGGGTGGSVSPLLAIAQALKAAGGFEFLFVGERSGIEKVMVKEAGLDFRPILAGKLRRYFAWQNFTDLLKIFLAFWQALFLIISWKPDLIMSAGSFVSVPVVWAGWILGKKIIVHQQDVRPGLANKVMAPFAKVITVTFEKSLADYGKKAVWTGNPNRQLSNINYQLSKKEALAVFNLKENIPTVFIYGGGTGAEGINKLVETGLDTLLAFCQVIHATGKGKMNARRHANYHPYEFLGAKEMAAAISIADLVVGRAGLGTLTELSAAGKPAIIIPMPDSHQEDNAALLVEKDAAAVLNQKILTSDEFVAAIKFLLDNTAEREKFSRNIKLLMKSGANEEFIRVIVKLLNC